WCYGAGLDGDAQRVADGDAAELGKGGRGGVPADGIPGAGLVSALRRNAITRPRTALICASTLAAHRPDILHAAPRGRVVVIAFHKAGSVMAASDDTRVLPPRPPGTVTYRYPVQSGATC